MRRKKKDGEKGLNGRLWKTMQSGERGLNICGNVIDRVMSQHPDMGHTNAANFCLISVTVIHLARIRCP